VKRRESLESRALLAWAVYAPAISIPVLLAPEPLYYFRRLFFVYPLAPILAAVALSRRNRLLVPFQLSSTIASIADRQRQPGFGDNLSWRIKLERH